MSFTIKGIWAALHRDELIAARSTAAAGLNISSTYTIDNGDRMLELLFNTAVDGRSFTFTNLGTGGMVIGGATGRISVLQFAVGGGTPSTEIPIITHNSGSVKMVGYGTDRIIRIYDDGGTERLKSFTAANASGVTKFTVVYDTLTAASKVILRIYVRYGDVWAQEAWVNTGLDPDGVFFTSADAVSFGVAGSTDYGADLHFQGVGLDSTTAADAPHLTAFPDIEIIGGANIPPTSTITNEWDTLSGAATAHEAVDDYPNDGDGPTGSHIQTGVANEKFLLEYSASNPVPSGSTILAAAVGFVFRTTGASKVAAYPLMSDGTNDAFQETGQPTTSYTGGQEFFNTAPDGSAWAYADADANAIQFGMRTLTDAERGALAVTARVTNLALSWAYYRRTLPVGDAIGRGPTLAGLSPAIV